VAVGGIVEIVPLYFQRSTTQPVEGLKPYTALQLAGRDIYTREGCYNCHSQMIRPLYAETLRYGHFSTAGEFVYDHPFQWGSKRTGPDLHRVGGKYSDEWHRVHLTDPRDLVPESNMPAYPWFERSKLETDTIQARMKALRAVGVPYTDDMIANAQSDTYVQAAPDTVFAEGVTKRYGEATNVRAFDGIPGVLAADPPRGFVQSVAFGAAIPAQVVFPAVPVVFAVRVVVLLPVADQIVEREPIVAGDVVDAVHRPPVAGLEEVAAAGKTGGNFTRQARLAAEEAS
jgi:cytochrome c oxidase cbb3-type subunit 2